MNTVVQRGRSVAVRYPAPASPALAWFLNGWTDIPEIADGLRSTVVRRMSSLISAQVANAMMMTICVVRHPHDILQLWAGACLAIEVLRLMIIVRLIVAINTRSLRRRRILVDLFVASSLVSSLLTGLSCFIFMRSGDSVLTAFSVVFAVGIIGAMSGRSPGTPRLTLTQMILVLVPLTAGILSNEDTAVRLLALMMPPYIVGMATIAAQLHRDYVDMLTAQYENKIRALHCGLTGLANAGSFHECLSEVLAEPEERPVAVLALDLDGFKGVNDRYGHPAGDELLKMVAIRLRAIESDTVTTARIGGDEFAVVICGEADDAVERLADHLILSIAIPYQLSEGMAVIAASIGIARRCDGDRDAAALYARADRALYRAKAAGKGMWRRDEAPSAAEATASGRMPLQGGKIAHDGEPQAA